VELWSPHYTRDSVITGDIWADLFMKIQNLTIETKLNVKFHLSPPKEII
jgi:hypothetical protein